jgi:peptidoglycan/LPS O-acetylase OafA/YrhL
MYQLARTRYKNGNDHNRNKVLDALRAVAILLVLGRHTDISELWNRIGWCGVDLFFVLSGFLISGLLFQEYKRFGDIRLKTFWLRRGLKIYPAFYVCTLAQAFVYLVMFGKVLGTKTVVHRFLIDATFLSSYFEGVSGHVWSLAVEEHFYFVLPVFLLILMKLRGEKKENPFASIPAVFLLVAAGSLWLRMAAKPASYGDYYSYLLPTHLRMDGLFCGVMVGYLFHFKPQLLARVARWPLLVAGVILLCPVYYLNIEYSGMYTWGLTSTFLGFACILVWAIHVPFRQDHLLALPVNLLARIGFYSYSIYLWHWLIIFYLRPYVRLRCMKTSSPVAWSSAMERGQWLFCVVFSIIVGIGMAVVIEQPALRLRDRWFPSRTRQVNALSGASDTASANPRATAPLRMTVVS